MDLCKYPATRSLLFDGTIFLLIMYIPEPSNTYWEALTILTLDDAIHSTYQLNRKRDEREQNMIISALTSRNKENNLLIELRDIRDELEIISLLHDEQMRVVRDMGTTIGLKDDHMFQIIYKRLRDEINDQVVDVVNLLKLAARIAVDVSSEEGSY